MMIRCRQSLLLLLQSNLFPTVGLQTPGEVVEANFGQSPFLFDIDDYIQVMLLRLPAIYLLLVNVFPL